MWPKKSNSLDPKGKETINLYVSFTGLARSTNCIMIYKDDITKKPCFQRNTDIQEFSPSFVPSSEGLHYLSWSARDLFPYIYLRKGGEYHLDMEIGKVTFKGTDQKLNQFLINYNETINQLTKQYLPSKHSVKSYNPTDFVNKLNEMQAAHRKLIQDQPSWMPQEVKSKLISDYQGIRNMILTTFIDAKYTQKQSKTALKYLGSNDFSDEHRIITERDYARAAAHYYYILSLSLKMKRDPKSFIDFLLSQSLSLESAQRVYIEFKLIKRVKDDVYRHIDNQFLLDYLSCNEI
jgi:hypothetical protein